MLKYCIYIPRYKFSNGIRSPKPNNLNEILRALKQPRGSLSPSTVPKTAHEDFLEIFPGPTEDDLARKIIPLLTGAVEIPNSSNCICTNLISRTGKATVTLKPDYFEGALFEDVDITVREDLDKQIIPTTNVAAPIVPNFFLEIKNNGGRMKVAEAQTTMNGAHGAYIMHALQSYLTDGEPEYDGNAYAFTAILVDTYLKLYAHHLIAPTQSASPPSCYTTLLKVYGLEDEEAYSAGRAAFRNLRLRAKEDRDRFIAKANERARRLNALRQNTVDEGTDDGSTERGDNFSRAGEEQQGQGSSPLSFYEANEFIESSQNAQDANQEAQNADSQLTNAATDLGYETDNTEPGVDLTTSFTSTTYESYRQPRRQLRTHSSLASSSTRQTPRNAPSSSSTQKRTRSPPSPPLTRQRRRRLESAG
jgi:hypothetical protein